MRGIGKTDGPGMEASVPGWPGSLRRLASLRWTSWLTAGLLFFWVAILCALLWAGYCALTNGMFALYDYGRYSNMIWNSGRGDWFRCLVDETYLSSHLSFSLAILGPLFHVWDDPFLLSLVQWWFLAAGGIILFAAGRRQGVPAVLLAGVLVWFAGYPYTQSVHLSEFHGVSANFVLVPWLYYCLHFRRRLAWLPLVLILGLREEAGLLVAPLLLYHAAAHRWKAGFVLAGVALAYSVLAIGVIYPAMMDRTIFAQHGGKSDLKSILASWSTGNNLVRLRSLGLIVLPALPLMRRGGWRPLLIVPSVAVLVTLGSAWPRQFDMRLQHPAPVVALLVVALVEAAARGGRRAGGWKPAIAAALAGFLAVVTLGGNYREGFLPGTRHDNRRYWNPGIEGEQALWMGRHVVPKRGVLVTRQRLAAYVCNRAGLITWDSIQPRHRVDVVFDVLGRLAGEKGVNARDWLETGEFGVRAFDGYHVVLQRGGSTNRNAAILRDWGLPVVHFAWTKMEDRGVDLRLGERGVVRFWQRGAKHREPVLAHGGAVRLEPGSYVAEFHLRAELPARYAGGTWGGLRLHPLGVAQPLAEDSIRATPAGDALGHIQNVPFQLAEPMSIEPRVVGGDATLWLDRVVFRREAGDPPASHP